MRVDLDEIVAFDDEELQEGVGLPESGKVLTTTEAVADYARAILMDGSLTAEEKRDRLMKLCDMLVDEDDEDDEDDDEDDEKEVQEGLGDVDLVESDSDSREWLRGLL